MVYAVYIQRRESRELRTNSPGPLSFPVEAIPGFIYIMFDHCVHKRSTSADGLCNSMIEDTDSHILLPLIMSTCSMLPHVLVEWQKNKDVHPEASKS